MSASTFDVEQNFSPRELYLLTDQLDADASFLVHQILHARLRDRQQCILASFSKDYKYWSSIAIKSHIKLEKYLDDGQLHFIDGLTSTSCSTHEPGDSTGSSSQLICPPLFATSESIKLLYAMLERILAESSNPLVILDDMSCLEWMGLSTVDLSRFIRAIKSLLRQYDATLLIRYRVLSLEQPSDLQLFLIHQSFLHIEVLALSSGRSGLIDGEIAVHSGPICVEPSRNNRSRDRALQYKLTDSGAIYFERGTNQNVL